MHQPQPCKSPSIPTNGGNTGVQAAWNVPDLRFLLVKSPHAGVRPFSTRPRAMWRTFQNGLVSLEGGYAASPVVHCFLMRDTDRG